MTALHERWMRLRNFQSQDFWAMVFARPLTILFLMPVAETAWVTPNRITVLALLAKGAGIAFLALDPSYAGGVVAAALVNLGLILDNMDGTLARYRRCGTFKGYYFDKVADAATLALIFWAMGYRTFLVSGNLLDLAFPLMAFGGAMVAGYSKWVADRVVSDIHLQGLAHDEQALASWVRDRVEHDRPADVPKRTPAQWGRWFGKAVLSILLFNEVDIFFWIAVALVAQAPWIFTRALCPVYTLGLVAGPIIFAIKIVRAEKAS